MLDALKQLYKEHFINELDSEQVSSDYIWFRTDAGEVFGILQSALPERELQLLSGFFTLEHSTHDVFSTAEKEWYDFLINGEFAPTWHGKERYIRLIHFQLSYSIDQRTELSDVLKGISDYSNFILWLSPTNGVVIEQNKQLPMADPIVDFVENVIESDFFTSIKLMIGNVHPLSPKLADFFQWEDRVFKHARLEKQSQAIFTISEAMIYTVINSIEIGTKRELADRILAFQGIDEEIVKTVETFIKQNLNVSSTAKALFMHRNTVQYRIDKFIEITNTDIKTWDGAFIVYVALLCERYFQTHSA